MEAVESRCKCRFPLSNLLEESFICEVSPDLLTYRAAVLGTYNYNGTQILSFIQHWASGGPRIKTGPAGEHVRVDSSCPVEISSLDEPECGQNKDGCLTFASDPSSFALCAEHQLDDKDIAKCFGGCVHSS